MFNLFKSVLFFLTLGVFAHLAYAQAPSTGPAAPGAKQAAPPAKSAPAPVKELNGYKQAAWGMSKEEVKASLSIDLSRKEPHNSVIDLPWEILRLAAIADSDPDDLLGKDLVWYYGERQDVIIGFYKDRFFSYTSSLDKILPPADYRQRIISIHGASSRVLSFEDTDPAENKVVGAYDVEIWEKKKTMILLRTEKLFPGPEVETNCGITYLGSELFGEFKKDAAAALAQRKDEETKQSEKLLREQQDSALEVIQ